MSSEEQCVRALELHEEKLLALANVQGLGIVAEEGQAADSDNLAVAVYVEKKLPVERLAPEHRIPETLEVPDGDDVQQVSVRVIEQGPVWSE